MLRTIRLALVPLLAAVTLAGCATVSPEAKIRTKLMDAGLRPSVAGCMAERMVDRLSITQLRRIQSLSGFARHDVRDMSINEFAHRLRALDDPEIVSVVLRSGIGCSIAG